MKYYFRDRIIESSEEATELLWDNCGEGEDFVEVIGGVGEVIKVEKYNEEYCLSLDMISTSPMPFSRNAGMGSMEMSFWCSEEILTKLIDDIGIAYLEDLVGTVHIIQSGVGANAISPYEFNPDEDYE